MAGPEVAICPRLIVGSTCLRYDLQKSSKSLWAKLITLVGRVGTNSVQSPPSIKKNTKIPHYQWWGDYIILISLSHGFYLLEFHAQWILKLITLTGNVASPKYHYYTIDM